MNVLDLLIRGIEIQMFNEDKVIQDTITFRFRKGNQYYQHIITCEEVEDFDGEGGGSYLLEDIICRQVMAYFDGIEKPCEITLKLGDWVKCKDGSGVVGRIINFYTSDSCGEQIMVKTPNGKRYHAPASLWKPYKFGVEVIAMNLDENSCLLNTNDKHTGKFTENNEISIDRAFDIR